MVNSSSSSAPAAAVAYPTSDKWTDWTPEQRDLVLTTAVQRAIDQRPIRKLNPRAEGETLMQYSARIQRIANASA